MSVTVIVLAALWGAAAGLLLPRAAHRLSVEPEEEWRDACPSGHPFTGFARGWAGTGRCARCAGGSGARGALRTAVGPATYTKTLPYPLVGALACAALAAATGPRPELAVWLLLTPFALLLAGVDLRVNRLPDVLTLPLAAGAAVLLGAADLLPGNGGSWLGALLGGAGLGGVYLLLHLVNPDGMAFGDVKLSPALGAALGWYGFPVLFIGTFAGFLLGSLYGLGRIVVGRGTRRSHFPFGPFMIAGAWLGVLIGALGAR
ncbi:prepilin peptidase [Streptomyces spiroverticillatus]|uniref:Prepilin peptidase n=1 Tax=Streptomyces finlayi TaxID=67296 RepID=A0A918WSE8_9ACTN|nr:A24 family peptidase [Streptomyces finlayi]GGZ86440.1 prepilin peptidase [Streptomyces spiroverticillatus]GHC77978.1 prepilin peptidase [Streptomyces finlayi]